MSSRRGSRGGTMVVLAALLAGALLVGAPLVGAPQTTAHAATETGDDQGGDGALLRADQRARRLDASPHAPVARLLVQCATCVWGKLAVAVPIWGAAARPGLFVHLLPLLEVSADEEFGSILPAQYWRGRLALEAGWRAPLRLAGRVPAVFSLSLELMHESDHRTEFVAHTYDDTIDVLYVDDLALRAGLTVRPGRWTLHAALNPRVHWLSCTRSPPYRRCNAVEAGGQGFEVDAALVASWRPFSARGRLRRLEPFSSLELAWIIANDQMIEERRVAWSIGAAYAGEQVLWQLYFSLMGGNGVGLMRLEEALRLGVGLAMSLW